MEERPKTDSPGAGVRKPQGQFSLPANRRRCRPEGSDPGTRVPRSGDPVTSPFAPKYVKDRAGTTVDYPRTYVPLLDSFVGLMVRDVNRVNSALTRQVYYQGACRANAGEPNLGLSLRWRLVCDRDVQARGASAGAVEGKELTAASTLS